MKVDLNVSGKRFIDRPGQMSDAELLELLSAADKTTLIGQYAVE